MGPEDVLAAYEERINQHDFDLLVPLIASEATFWFSDGSYLGHAAIRAAFERTWATLHNDTYRLEDRHWIARSDSVAVCRYRFHWSTVRRQAGIGQRPGNDSADTRLGRLGNRARTPRP